MANIILTHPDGTKTERVDLGDGIYANSTVYIGGGATLTVTLSTLPDTAAARRGQTAGFHARRH